jgi:hypothetical protein
MPFFGHKKVTAWIIGVFALSLGTDRLFYLVSDRAPHVEELLMRNTNTGAFEVYFMPYAR